MKDFNLPKTLQRETDEYMKSVIQRLKDSGVIDEIDSGAMLMLAQNYDTYIKAMKILQVEGLTVEGKRGLIAAHPAVKIAKDAQTQAMAIMTEFGLTAKSRTKISKLNTSAADSPLTAFVKKAKK